MGAERAQAPFGSPAFGSVSVAVRRNVRMTLNGVAAC